MAMSEVEWIDIFSGNLKSLLDETGMTQQELANKTGLSKATISKYLNGQVMPSVAALVNIYHVFNQYLNVTINDILYFYDRLEFRPSRR